MTGRAVSMNNIYLIGFMGSGKSAAATYLMRQYGLPYVEMDREIEADCGMPIPEIFEKMGEGAFRQKETLLLRKIAEREELIVSCGGGVPMRTENVELMRASGKIVFLKAEPETILKRVQRSENRPLLNGRKTVEGIQELLEQRRDKYEAAADFVIQTDGRKIAGLLTEDSSGFRDTVELMSQSLDVVENKFTGNTTIGIVITNAAFNKTQLCKIASMAHNGYARSIRPLHTSADGDSIYAVSAGSEPVDQDLAGTLAAEVMSEAIIRAVESAEGAYGFPAQRDLDWIKK